MATTCPRILNKLVRTASVLIVAQLTGNALAQQAPLPDAGAAMEVNQGNVLRLQFSPYTRHNTYSSEHRAVVLIGVEREHPDASLDGISLFSNSFGRPVVYMYPWGGVYREPGGIRHLSFKWSAGLMYGYRDPYENKVPLNYKGLSIAVIPALAYEFRPGWSVQLNLLGTAAVMFQVNMPLN